MANGTRSTLIVAIGVACVAAALLVPRLLAFDPGADVQVQVETTEPVRVWLSADPTAAEAQAAMRKELLAVASTSSPAMAAELTHLANDDEFLGSMAGRGVQRLSTDAAALAFSTHSAAGDGDVVTIVSITVALLPTHRLQEIGLAHEDGHAYINSQLAEQCGASIVRAEIETGATGNSLTTGIIRHLQLLETQGHAHYHAQVSDRIEGSHTDAAERAVAAIVGGGCLGR